MVNGVISDHFLTQHYLFSVIEMKNAINKKTRNHQPETLDFVVVWHEDILDSKSSNYDSKWVYDKTTKIIRNPNTNKEVKVIVLPEHIFRYLKSKKSK